MWQRARTWSSGTRGVADRVASRLRKAALLLAVVAVAVGSAAVLVMHPPGQGAGRGEVSAR